MTRRRWRFSNRDGGARAMPLLLLGLDIAILVLPSYRAHAQGAAFQVGRFLDDPALTVYRAGAALPLAGPLGVQVHGTTLQTPGGAGRDLWGVGADLTIFQGGRRGLYGVAGVASGAVTGGDLDTWGSWSAGLGYEALLGKVFSLGLEGRWRELSWNQRQGMEISARLGIVFGGGPPSPGARLPGAAAPREASPPPPEREPGVGPPLAPSPRSARTVIERVVATAREAMGRPYEWGGRGGGDDGFDCSGLIQYAYGEHGIALPRRSVDQAKEGSVVARRLDALRAGDILTFSSRGGVVTHVGLYLGNGTFIHSASRGVQESKLTEGDPYGRWWYKRWVGVRRIVE